MPAGQISGKLNLNAAGWSSAVNQAKREIKGLQDATAQMGHGTVSQMQAASASIRVLEGGMTGNIRAAERFISTIPGVGKALQAAFPLVGGIALAGVFVKIGEEAAKAVEKIQKAPQVISNAFREMNLSAESSIDSLKLSTAKMNEQIALLSGKRPNTLAIDLAEASLAADKLAISLDNDNRKIAELLKANGLSALSGFLGKAGTADVTGSVNFFDQQISDLGARHQHAVRTGDTAGAADLEKQLNDKRAAALAYANSQIAQRQQGQGPGSLNQDANLAGLTGFRNTLIDQQDDQTATANDKAAAAQLKKQEDAKKYAEMQKQAQSQLLKLYEDQEKQQNAANKMTINEEIQFWNDRVSAFTKGGEAYLEVQNRIYDLIAKRPDLFSENKKNQASVGKSQVEGNDLVDAGASALNKINVDQIERSAKATEHYNEEVAKGNEIQQRAGTEFAETSIQMAVAQGNMSGLAAAQALAAIHASDHAESLQRINAALAEQIWLINEMPDDKMSRQDKDDAIRAAQQGAANQTSSLNGSFGSQQQVDAQKVKDQQLGPAMQDTLKKMGQDWSNMTQSIVQTMTRAIDSFNDDIAKAVTGNGKKSDFGHTFTQAGESLVKTGLQKSESVLLGSIFGKGNGPTGQLGASAQNAMWVQMATPGTTGAGGAGVVGAVGGAAAPLLGGLAGKLGAFIQPFIPHFAAGGDFVANHPMLVGENGPEILNPGFSGSITPNSAIGGGDTHLHVDARGSNDPEAIHAAVRRAAPAIIAAAVQAQHHAAKRSPRSR